MMIDRLPAIVICDSTLRHADSALGVAFTQREKVEIATALDRASVDEIELEVASTRIDSIGQVMGALRESKAIGWGRLALETVENARRAGLKAVYLCIPLSGRRTTLLERVGRVVGDARERGLAVAVSGEDASRADFDLVSAVIAAAEAAGAHRFRYADTMGVLDPLRTHSLFRRLCAETDIELEFHGHDDFGLATANTLAAVQGGATHVSANVLGLGKRAGTAPLEDVVSAIRLSPMHHTRIKPAHLPALAALVAGASRPHFRRGLYPFEFGAFASPVALATGSTHARSAAK